MSEPAKAVFLSYASQDTEAAKRICDALRAAGVEVWFDVEGGLETGDEWDAKIRRQIKECVLFLPVISANTQAREEGYFRIEWDLAAERARGIASGVPFILPIVIDDTREPDALVPDRFRSVQWTRARGGEFTPETRAKFAKLWSHRAGLAKHRAASSDSAGSGPTARSAAPADGEPASLPTAPESRSRSRVPAFAAVGAAVVLVAAGAFYLLNSARRSSSAEIRSPSGDAKAAAPAGMTAPTTRDWPRDPELKRAVALLDGVEVIPEDFRLAEEIATGVLAKNPTDPEAVTVMARVHSMWLLRGWDRSNGRYQKAKNTAERALQLAPDEPEAHIALAIQLYARGAELPRALALAQRAVDLAPTEARFHRIRDNCLWNLHVPGVNVFLDLAEADESPGLKEALASARRTVERFPQDPLVRYELARHYRDIGRWADFERVNDEAIALYPLANALVWKARARFGLHGDLPGMKAVLDQVPARVRGIERTVFGYFLYAAFTNETAVGRGALNGFAESWMIDFDFRGPKAQLVAALLELEGRHELARVQYELALAELKQSRLRNPEDVQTYVNEAWILRGLGRTDEARAALRTSNEALVRPMTVSPLSTWWFQAIPANLLLGQRAFALTLIRESIATLPSGRETLRRRFALDPRLAEFRNDPEIAALLAEPAANAAASLSPGTQLAERAKALYTKFAYTRDDLATAENLARRATETEPASAAAWGTLAAVHGVFLQRGWDLSDRRRAAAQESARKALGLDPEQPEALFGLGYVFSRQGSPAQGLELFRRALASDPVDTRLARAYAGALATVGRQQESTAVLEEARRRNPKDPLVHYSLALNLVSYSRRPGDTPERFARGIAHLDDGIAVQPLATLLLLRMAVAAGWEGNFPRARALLTQLEQRPLEERIEDRAVYLPLWFATLDRNVERAQAVASLTARDYFEDWVALRRPKAWHLALVRSATGKEALARLDWQRAETLIRERLRTEPNVPVLQWELACTLAWLGRAEEAEALFSPIEAAWREELTAARAVMLAHYAAARGDGAKTAQFLRRCLDDNVTLTRHTFPLDPWFDKVRDHPEVKQALAEASTQP